jgi:hypothetical protein
VVGPSDLLGGWLPFFQARSPRPARACWPTRPPTARVWFPRCPCDDAVACWHRHGAPRVRRSPAHPCYVPSRCLTPGMASDRRARGRSGVLFLGPYGVAGPGGCACRLAWASKANRCLHTASSSWQSRARGTKANRAHAGWHRWGGRSARGVAQTP